MDNLDKMQECLRILRSALSGKESVQQITIFLYIATNPGCSMDDIERDTGIKYGTVGRTLFHFGLYADKDGAVKGFDIVESKPNMHERRRKDYSLTRKGEQLAKQLDDILAA